MHHRVVNDLSISSRVRPRVSGVSFQKKTVATAQIAANVKNAACMPRVVTNQGKTNATRALLLQVTNVAIDEPRPLTRLGKISGVITQITEHIEIARQAM